MRGVNKKGPMREVVGRSKHTDAAPQKLEEKKPEEKKPRLKVAEDGSMAGRLGRTADGQVKLGGLTLRQPADREVVTQRLSQDKLLVLRGEGNTVSVSTRKLGLEINGEKGKLKGLVLPVQVDGRQLVELGPLGYVRAPAAGGTDSYLLGPDKLLVLQSKDDGTVSVYTRSLGIEGDKKGRFRGDVLPSDGMVEFAGHQLKVGHLKAGQERSENIKIDGKKYEADLRLNADGSVTVSVSPKRRFNLLGLLGGVASLFIPVLGPIISIYNGVKNGIQSIMRGDLLGAATGFAGAAGILPGPLGNAAAGMAKVGNLVQGVNHLVKNGPGDTPLGVVGNMALLGSDAASLGASVSRGHFQQQLAQAANGLGKVASYSLAGDRFVTGHDFAPLANVLIRDVGRSLIEKPQGSQAVQLSTQKGVKLTPFDTASLPSDPLLEKATFKGFTSGPDLGLDIFGIRGTDHLPGSGEDMLLAQAQGGYITVTGPDGKPVRFSNELVTQLPITIETFREKIPAWRREQINKTVRTLVAEYGQTTDEKGNRLSRPRLNYRNLGGILDKLTEARDLTHLEKAFAWSVLAWMRRTPGKPSEIDVTNDFVNPDVIDSRSPGNTANHIVIPFTDPYHAPLSMLPHEVAVEEINRHESTLLGVRTPFNFNLGDTMASFGSVAAFRAFREGGFEAFAEEWKNRFVW